MNSKILSVLAGAIVASVSAIAPAPVQATTFVNTSGVGCHPASGSNPDLRYLPDGVYNAGSSWVEVVCPVSWAPTSTYPGYFWISGSVPSGQYVWGLVYAYGWDGTLHSSAYFDNSDYWGSSYFIGWAPLLAANFWDVISVDLWLPPGGKLRGVNGE